MLTLGQQLTGKNIMSLRIGRPVGIANEPIINPNNLKIEGWYATDVIDKRQAILLSQDVREILPQGFVVNDHEALTNPKELVRLKEVLDYKFVLTGKPVYTEHKKRLGKVSDFAFEKNGFFIQKLYVNQSILKSFSGGGLVIDRTQIIEITQNRITVKEATVEEPAIAPAAA